MIYERNKQLRKSQVHQGKGQWIEVVDNWHILLHLVVGHNYVLSFMLLSVDFVPCS